MKRVTILLTLDCLDDTPAEVFAEMAAQVVDFAESEFYAPPIDDVSGHGARATVHQVVDMPNADDRETIEIHD
jgi:hypothetical protein